MSLFIGNISKKVTAKQFEQAFRSFGRCKVDLRKKFAFVQYDSEKDAEKAKNELHNKDLCGLRLNIEWSKNSGRFQQNNNRDRGRKERRRSVSRSWDRHKRYRSSSRDRRRESPDYEQETDVPPMCRRDYILLEKLEQRQQRQRAKKEAQQQQLLLQKQVQEQKEQQSREQNHKVPDTPAATAPAVVAPVKQDTEREAGQMDIEPNS